MNGSCMMVSNIFTRFERLLITNPDSVTSSVLHPNAGVLATCSGQRHFPDYHRLDDDEGLTVCRKDNSLRIWAL